MTSIRWQYAPARCVASLTNIGSDVSYVELRINSAAEAAARFKGEQPGPIYARFTNPTVSMMEARLAALEGAERCVAFASGMAAIWRL